MSIVEKAIGKLRSGARDAAPPVERRRIETPRVARAEPLPEVSTPGSDRVAAGPPLQIDLEALRRAGALPPPDIERQLADEYRRIKWPLLARAFGRDGESVIDGNLVMITSALPGDGKTFTSLNLAHSIARERDSSVLLIDADISKAHVSELLGVRDRPGLTDLLLDPSLEPADVTLATSVDGLRVMPAGRRTDHGPELFASQRMRDIVALLGSRNRERAVIFDSSPLLATNESQVLAKLVGQVLMVVRSNGTPRPAVEEAIALLDRSRSISLILNQTRPLFGAHSYYAGYYHYESGQAE
jgi:exopolysaccharide/PEP-CTERM locus tyrosine autokinase